MTKLTKWLIAAGLVIIIVSGFFAGFYYQKIKNRLSVSADIVTGNSPLTASQQNNDNIIFQQAMTKAWTDYVKQKGMPGQGKEVSINDFNLQRYLDIKPARAASKYNACTGMDIALFTDEFENELKNSKVPWGKCEQTRNYVADGTLTLDANYTNDSAIQYFKITINGTRTMTSYYRDSYRCRDYAKYQRWVEPYSFTFYTNTVGEVVSKPQGSWQPYCQAIISNLFQIGNPDIGKTCPCDDWSKPSPTSTPTPTPTPPPVD